MDENTPILQAKIKKELDDLSKEMQGATFKIIKNQKKINIQCSVFEGKNEEYGLISMTDVTKV